LSICITNFLALLLFCFIALLLRTCIVEVLKGVELSPEATPGAQRASYALE
jgi:hypothetical protein